MDIFFASLPEKATKNRTARKGNPPFTPIRQIHIEGHLQGTLLKADHLLHRSLPSPDCWAWVMSLMEIIHYRTCFWGRLPKRLHLRSEDIPRRPLETNLSAQRIDDDAFTLWSIDTSVDEEAISLDLHLFICSKLLLHLIGWYARDLMSMP